MSSELATSFFERIPAFDGTNYRSWSFSMKMLLKARELWEVIEEPVAEGSSESPSGEKRGAKWHKKDQLALSNIVLALKPAEQEQVHDCKTAKEAWDRLQEVYQAKGMHRLLSLLKDLSTAQFEKYMVGPPGSGIKDYIRMMIQTADEITAIGYKLDRPVVVAFILNGLPEVYRYLVVNLESQIETISFQDLQARLLDEDKRIRERYDYENRPIDGGIHGYIAKGCKRHVDQCEFCGKKGHTAERCYARRSCTSCGRKGHFEDNCWRKQQQDKQDKFEQGQAGFAIVTTAG